MTCDSNNLIYALICNGCNKYYIGETGDKLRNRARTHRAAIMSNSSISSDTHIFNCTKKIKVKCNIVPIYKMTVKSAVERRAKESLFIKKYQSELNEKMVIN